MDGHPTPNVKDARLLNERTESIKQLSGFQKHFRIPHTVSHSDQQFLGKLAAPELDADLQATFASLRSAFGFKRKQISVSGPDEGGGMIETPHFNYEITVSYLEEDPSKVVWRKIISGIRDPEKLYSPEFVKVFGTQFSILEMALSGDLDIEAIVDLVEDAESETVSVTYDMEVTWCEIQVAGSIAAVKIGPETIRVVSRQEVSPNELRDAYQDVQRQFITNIGSREGNSSIELL